MILNHHTSMYIVNNTAVQYGRAGAIGAAGAVMAAPLFGPLKKKAIPSILDTYVPQFSWSALGRRACRTPSLVSSVWQLDTYSLR